MVSDDCLLVCTVMQLNSSDKLHNLLGRMSDLKYRKPVGLLTNLRPTFQNRRSVTIKQFELNKKEQKSSRIKFLYQKSSRIARNILEIGYQESSSKNDSCLAVAIYGSMTE